MIATTASSTRRPRSVSSASLVIASPRDKIVELQVIELSKDHKPDVDSEKARIEQNGGEVQTYVDTSGKAIGPSRVWVKNENFPGLAMSRSFGDTIASYVGVSVYPEIKEITLTVDDAYIVLASDGVWEFMTNEEIAHIVYPYYFSGNAEKAAEEIVKQSFVKWKNEEVLVDDIT